MILHEITIAAELTNAIITWGFMIDTNLIDVLNQPFICDYLLDNYFTVLFCYFCSDVY